ncbi:MA20_20990 [Bartonella apihabitans]|uniref:hypothetical protein n=2 Tax=Bartonella TaxID=773 RepID=UPI0018DEA516|nr:hypothetical protein [Bartonella sp. P0291]MBH9997335.1 hypothetical protein [Bartonella sp. M0192]MBH9999495.1 hypothetical protein [Bartonella sp. M0191]MBI0007959.1 hypothetical protein [Bartonella sp. M0193]MBI0010786.1 hypothetical protein [Bartonella sp. M0176]MBI0012093.1 hypothetical protein [Bartonella apihabitans]
MLRTKTIFLISCSVVISGCMSDSLQYFQSPSKTSNETTSSIRPASPLGTINSKDYEAWRNAYNAYNKQATAYWDQISAKRKLRNEKRARGQTIELTDYVLSQPPLYSGPAKPSTGKTTGPSRSIPGVDDFVAASKRVYGFRPERPSNESEFMRSYVNAAQEIGLTREQLVSIYAFETGGDGTHDLQSGMIKGKANARPISTAIGYNQLVATASVSLMWEYGNDIAKELRQKAQQASGTERTKLLEKANVVERMTAKAKTVPHNWGAQSELAKTDAGLGMHAMTMDKDVGPLLQIHKLRTSLTFLRRKGVSRPLSGAELEMLNLTGDGNGYDMVTMPSQYRAKVPTANFFLRPGYERNPVAIRNNTVAALLDATESKMEANMQKDGAQMLNRIYQSTTLARN